MGVGSNKVNLHPQPGPHCCQCILTRTAWLFDESMNISQLFTCSHISCVKISPSLRSQLISSCLFVLLSCMFETCLLFFPARSCRTLCAATVMLPFTRDTAPVFPSTPCSYIGDAEANSPDSAHPLADGTAAKAHASPSSDGTTALAPPQTLCARSSSCSLSHFFVGFGFLWLLGP